MIEMIDDKAIPVTWVNAHTLSGITVGKALTIQNKGIYPVLAMVSTSAPAAGSKVGFRLLPNVFFGSSTGDVVWLRAEDDSSYASIQE